MEIDSYGRLQLSADDLFDALYRGEDVGSVYAYGSEIDQYNDLIRYYDKPEYLKLRSAPPMDISPEAYHERRGGTWSYPARYDEMDLWSTLEAKCKTDDERARLEEERKEYEARKLTPVLRLMMFLVDDFRKRDILWGVGRGSSVASFVLYLIGITKINPMIYGLEIGEFLKD